MKHRYPIRLLVADERAAEAAALVAALRRNRYRVTPRLVREVEELRSALADARFDLVLLASTLPGGTLADALHVTAGTGTPVVVLDDASTDRREVMIEALRLGARDVVDRGDPEMLQFTVQREVEALDNRRALARHAAARRAGAESVRWLVNAAREPVALVRRADIVLASNAFLDLFGLAPDALPLRDGMLECVSPDERDALSTLIEEIALGDERAVEVELTGRHATRDPFALELEIAPMVLEGARLHRVVARVSGQSAATAGEPDAKPTPERAGPVPARAPQQRPAFAVIHGTVPPPLPAAAQRPAAALPPAPRAPHAPADARAAFLHRVAACREAGHPEGHLACVVYVELDNFEGLKRYLGLEHVAGLMDSVRGHIADAAPAGATIERVADDAFAILVPDTTREGALQAHRDVEAAIGGRMVEVDTRTVLVSGSAGVARVKPEDGDPGAPLERAYRACQSELRVAPGILEVPDEPDDDEDEPLAGMAEDLGRALEDGRLWLVYQPIVRLRGEPIDLYEAFLRFRDADGNMVPPPVFLGAAEKAGMLPDIDLWLVHKAIDAIAEQQSKGMRTHIQIKLTHPSVTDVRIPLAVGRRVKQERIAPGRLIIETSETIAASQLKATRALMHAAHGFQCGTALEHFGVCRRPFQLLQHLPVDYLTVDSSLVNNIARDPACMARTRRIADRARALGKHTVAEYVEDPQSIALLYDTGIEFVQGNYIQPATEALDFEFSMMAG